MALGQRVGCLFAALLAGGLSACGSSATPDSGRLLPDFARQEKTVDRLQVYGAGTVPRVTLEKKDAVWRVAERAGWPADAGKVDRYLFALTQARRVEEKTDNPALYARLGVDPIASADAQGVELHLAGPGLSIPRLIIGRDRAAPVGTYVRFSDQARSWQTDRLLGAARDPRDWLDHLIVDRPLARIAAVEIAPVGGRRFRLVHDFDRFVVEGEPPATGDAHQADALASLLDQAQLDDVARDDAGGTLDRELRYVGIDGVDVTVQAWRRQGRVWIRLRADVDETRAAAWSTQAGAAGETAEQLRQRVAAWQARWSGYVFLLPAPTASVLMLGREQLLAPAP